MYNIEIRKNYYIINKSYDNDKKGYELNLEKLDMPCDSYRLLIN